MDQKKLTSVIFLLVILVLVLLASFFVLRPFLTEIIIAMVLVSIFYPLYGWLLGKLKGRKSIASLIMCLLILILIIVPLVNFVFYLSGRSIEAYGAIREYLEKNPIEEIINHGVLEKLDFFGLKNVKLQDYLINIAGKINEFIISVATAFLKGTTQFVTSLILIIFSMYFFFKDGDRLLGKLMELTPLANKYDRAIFKKFRDVGYSTILSTFITAIVQGLVGGIGFMIIGLPAFFPAVIMTVLSLLPYIGSAIVWLPVGVYLLFVGQIWQGIFLLAWGLLVVSLIDNFLRPYLIKGKAEVHPIFIFFSILGGIALFGFWGIIFGPLIIALTVTILDIYEKEFKEVLEK
jgi:predicted PurR-regulated permease PerM